MDRESYLSLLEDLRQVLFFGDVSWGDQSQRRRPVLVPWCGGGYLKIVKVSRASRSRIPGKAPTSNSVQSVAWRTWKLYADSRASPNSAGSPYRRPGDTTRGTFRVSPDWAGRRYLESSYSTLPSPPLPFPRRLFTMFARGD